MQNAMNPRYVQNRLLMFPSKSAFRVRVNTLQVRARFERGLIFILFTLWAVGMSAWTLFSLVGLSYGAGSGMMAAIPVPSSLPTLQSATIFAVRLLLGF